MAREKVELTIPTLIILLSLITGTLIYFIPRPIITQIYENYAENYQVIEVNPRVFIYLDTNSSITIRRNEPIQIELIRGGASFDIEEAKSKILDQLEIIIGDARITNKGTRFNIKIYDKRSEITITDGQIELHLPSQKYLIDSGRKIEIDNNQIITDNIINRTEVPPWLK